MKTVCVYCGSSDEVAENYKILAADFGEYCAKQGDVLVYGGGSSGLMGSAANAALCARGEVIGVIPQFLVEKEIILDPDGYWAELLLCMENITAQGFMRLAFEDLFRIVKKINEI